MTQWQTWDTAPKDGRWIIASSWDGSQLFRVSWGRDRHGDLAWCAADRSYGTVTYGGYHGLFGGWIDCPQTGPTFTAANGEPEDKR